MSKESQFKSSLSKEQIRVNHSTTQTLLDASFMHGQHDAFKEHMENNPVHHNCDGSLADGIELVMCKTRTLSDVAPTLIILLQNSAKWNHDDLIMPGRMTPYHVICHSIGDHKELLELMIKELGRTLLNVKDDDECTALMCSRRPITHHFRSTPRHKLQPASTGAEARPGNRRLRDIHYKPTMGKGPTQ